MTSEEKLDYLAGFFDADGSISSSSSGGRHRICLTVAQCTPTVPRIYKSLFGGRIYPVVHNNKNWRDAWIWQLHYTHNCEFGHSMWKRIVIKRRQLELAVRLGESRKTYGEGKRYRPVTPSGIAYRDSLLEMLKGLNGGKFDNEPVQLWDQSIAYWAGLFDGDGTIQLNKDHTSRIYRPAVRLYSVYKPILFAAQNQFGGFVRPSIKSGRCGSWEASNRASEGFLRKIEPFLIEKKDRCQKSVRISDLIRNGEKVLVPKKKHAVWMWPNSMIEQMNSLVQEFKVLNRRGIMRGIAFEEAT